MRKDWFYMWLLGLVMGIALTLLLEAIVDLARSKQSFTNMGSGEVTFLQDSTIYRDYIIYTQDTMRILIPPNTEIYSGHVRYKDANGMLNYVSMDSVRILYMLDDWFPKTKPKGYRTP